MTKQERGISPAPEQRKEWLSRYKDIQSVIKEKNITVVKELTSGFIIDDRGESWIFRRSPNGKIVPHHFTTLEKALDQIERVIQKKLGFQKKIGEVFINIAGENQDLVKIGSMLLKGADEYYDLPFHSRKAYSESLAAEAIPDLKRTHNVHKKAAAEVLQTILVSDDEFRVDAKQLIKAGKDAFDAAIEGIGIVNGETIRLMAGQYYFELWGLRSLRILERLADYHERLKTLNKAVKRGESIKERERLARRMEEKFKEKGPFWREIDKIKANPFFKRFNSSSVQHLRELPWALSTGRFDFAQKRLARVITELSALERDFDRGKIRLLQPKSTSRP